MRCFNIAKLEDKKNLRRSQKLDVEQRLANVHLQDLALDFDRADERPDLIAIEFFGVSGGERFKLLRHGRVLIGGGL